MKSTEAAAPPIVITKQLIGGITAARVAGERQRFGRQRAERRPSAAIVVISVPSPETTRICSSLTTDDAGRGGR